MLTYNRLQSPIALTDMTNGLGTFTHLLLAMLLNALLAANSGCVLAVESSAGSSIALTKSEWFDERTCTCSMQPNVRVHVNAPLDLPLARRTRLLVYALPNGNTIEQTLGCKMSAELDWHFDIQHVAAQLRLLRSIEPDERLVLICAEAAGLSWPSWRRDQDDANEKIAELVHAWRIRFGGDDAVVTLAGHSGGGSFIFGFIEGSSTVPDWIDRIILLDANYAFDTSVHADKLRNWLVESALRRLVVVAYDDRRIELNGKPVVGPDGGTFRATNRMLAAWQSRFAISKTARPPFTQYSGLDGRLLFVVHTNPNNKILHTALVGEMNGLVHTQTVGTRLESEWGSWGGPRAYARWIQPAPTNASAPSVKNVSRAQTSTFRLPLPARADDAEGGLALMKRLEPLSLEQREDIIYREVTRGNIPDFLRSFRRLHVRNAHREGKPVNAWLDVISDYLAVGSDKDFVRVPLTPQTAQRIADCLGCVLPTRMLVDAIDREAEIQLEPRPLVEARESVATFLQHQQIIQSQCAGRPRDALITGIKKDVVLSPRVFERPHRVAIYGWRKLDGRPIQNLTVVHVDRYVDYSHGIRLVKNTMEIDGCPASISELLQDEVGCSLVSDEGPMKPPRYPSGN